MGDDVALAGRFDATSRVSDSVDRFVAFLEKDRLPILGIFLYVLAVALFRDISEYFLLDQAFVTGSHPWIYSIAHHVAFYILTFLGLVFLLSAFSQRDTRKCMNFVASFFWVIILPPYLDHFLFGLNENYAYFSPTDFLNYLLHFSGSSFHPGQAAEIIAVVLALFGYTIWTQREHLGTVGERLVALLRIALLGVSALMALFFMATPGAYLPVGSTGGVPDFPNFDALRYYQYHLFIFAYYVVLGLVLGFALLFFSRREAFRRIASSMRPAQTVFFLGVVTAGIAMGWMASGGTRYVTNILQEPYWVNAEFVVLALCSAFMAWQVSTMWNDLSDRATDSPHKPGRVLAAGVFNSGTYAQASIVLAISAVLIAGLLSIYHALMLLVILALSYIYSMRPFRFKEHLLSPALIGLGTSLAFIFGFLTPYTVMVELPYTIGIDVLPSAEVAFPALTISGLLAAIYAFLGLVVGSMVTDVDGYAEDVRGGVKTIYTALGLDRGVMVVSTLIFVASLTTLFMFNGQWDLVVFPVLGVAATAAFYKYRSSRPVLIIAMIGFAYAAVRFMQILPH
ncbi:UbiA family prenyltransferase [Methanomassiliicoccus luminyensis]|uniref:UbiA family prenyltransferase n=1 Tax=Methanomassiliicoccus luminyensis TaxID=1080712 RepID=UPI000376EFCC|nr:UbiA family prenyltransferase [Methanomassiliicoccus luminyensis]